MDEVLLFGGAPWGFSLSGGVERCQPLIVCKIETGGKADLAGSLHMGDMVVSVNGVDISGMRQKAIGLVKSSHRTLRLGLQRYIPGSA